MTFIEKLDRLRLKKGYSERDLARALDIDQSAISRWRTRGSSPRPNVAKKMADHFGVSVNSLLDDNIGILPAETPWGNQLEETTQMTVAIGMVCRRLSSQQLAQLIQEVIKSTVLTESAKVFWAKIFSQWLTVQFDAEDFDRLTPQQKVAARRAKNYQKSADPAAAIKAS